MAAPSARAKETVNRTGCLEIYSIKNRKTGKYFPVVIRQIACQTFHILTEHLSNRDVLSWSISGFDPAKPRVWLFNNCGQNGM
ncbi:hypothetical protein N8524_10080 [Candidatus Puniceispirillum sp.]|nr:hypothetical protein [Candidatus Puniceispirillum sp.]